MESGGETQIFNMGISTIDVLSLIALKVRLLLSPQTVIKNINYENIKSMKETYEIPEWILKDIDNTLRMTSNIYNCPKRDTCFKRNLMRNWHRVRNILNEYEPTQEESMSYYSTPGLLSPELKK